MLSYRGLVLLLIYITPTWVQAHEGHRPLPTRGIEVDVDKGSMVLTKAARETLDVQTVQVKPESIHRSVTAYGSIVVPWNQHAVVASSLSGRIIDLKVRPGDEVSAGQVLAELDSSDLEQLQLEFRAAQVDAALAKQLVASTDLAGRSGAIPASRLADARLKLLQDQSSVEVASAKWKGLGLPMSMLNNMLSNPQQAIKQNLQLLSPIRGVVTHTDLTIGKVVDPKEHLFEILDLSTVWLKIAVLEKDLASITAGQPIRFDVTSIPTQEFTGVIDVVDSFLDPQTHLGVVWATIVNESTDGSQLLPGMSGSVRMSRVIETNQNKRLAIPMSAVIRDGAERFVLVEQEQTAAASTYRKQPLALGNRTGSVIEVLGGDLFPGDRVVTRGSHELGSFFAKGVLTVRPEVARDIQLKTQPVSIQSIADTINIDGVIDVPPMNRSVAAAQLGGTLKSILVDRGARVHRGDILAEVSSQPFQNLQLDLIKVQLELSLQKSVLENLRLAVDAIAQRRLWETESLVNQLTSRRETLSMRLKTVGLTSEQIDVIATTRQLVPSLPVRASIDGVMVGFDKFLGHVVRPDEPIFEIYDLSHAWVQGFISERDFPVVRLGQSVRVRLVTSPDEVLQGTIVRSGKSISDTDRTLSVWIELNDTPSFQVQHNMLARISIETGASSIALSVPRDAMVREGMRSYVFVEGQDQVFERRYVVTGAKNDLQVGIDTGLVIGESIVVRGATALQSGYAALK
jgi:membrane fusion protein, heavy metal efflux system